MVIRFAQEIESWLLKHNRPVIPLLQNGLSFSQIDSIVGNLSIRIPEELKELYTWHNGTNKINGYILGDVDFFPGFHFIPLEDALAYYRSFVKDLRWDVSWFPFFANGGGDFYVAQCERYPTKQTPVIGFMLGRDDHEVEYHSIEKMLQTFNECYKRDVFYISESGYLDTKSHEEIVISNAINPGLPRWLNELN